MAGRVRVTSRIKQWTAETENKLDVAVLTMATDIHRVATTLAPRDLGNLASSGRIKRRGTAHYSIIFGGGRIPYARIQELGGVIKPKTAEYLHFKTKDGEWVKTKSVKIRAKHYLKKGGDSVSRNAKRYLKGI